MGISKSEMIDGLSEELKPVLEKPEWADFVKTGHAKQRPPIDSNWWFHRGASILMKIDKLGPVGVSKLRTKYGSRKNRGMAPEHSYRASGNHIRKLLQQLEKAGLIEQAKKGNHKGRVLAAKGRAMLSTVEKKIKS